MIRRVRRPHRRHQTISQRTRRTWVTTTNFRVHWKSNTIWRCEGEEEKIGRFVDSLAKLVWYVGVPPTCRDLTLVLYALSRSGCQANLRRRSTITMPLRQTSSTHKRLLKTLPSLSDFHAATLALHPYTSSPLLALQQLVPREIESEPVGRTERKKKQWSKEMKKKRRLRERS